MQQIQLNWTLPATRTDGSPLLPGDIAKVSVQELAPGSPAVVAVDLPGTATSYLTPQDVSQDPGGYAFSVFVTDTKGLISAPDTVAITVPSPAQSPPAAVTSLAATIVTS